MSETGVTEQQDGQQTIISRREFRSMGTLCELLLRTEPAIASPVFDLAQAELARIEQLFTRFDPTSPIEQLNDAGYGLVDGDMRRVLEASLQAFVDTAGRVDVGIGADLIDAGYDRDFDELDVPEDPEREMIDLARDAHPDPQWTTVHDPAFTLDEDGVVQIREGVRIDLGGIAKGWASDRVRELLAPYGSCLVNLGGDIALHVEAGDEPWPVGVELGARTQSYAVAFGGLATSGQDRRVWRVPGSSRLAHHLIDSRTGRPAESDMLRITVIAGSCLEAEVWAKALFLEGVEAARGEAAERGMTAIIVGIDGDVHMTGLLA